jgi:hypothetical protein
MAPFLDRKVIVPGASEQPLALRQDQYRVPLLRLSKRATEGGVLERTGLPVRFILAPGEIRGRHGPWVAAIAVRQDVICCFGDLTGIDGGTIR